jgi:CCDC81-like HU domain protein/sporulation related protein
MIHSITKYISELLPIYECIILPKFGAFITNYKSASINREKNIISPPSKEILFNTNLKHNDGLLINHIAVSENISDKKAKNLLETYIKDIKYRLAKGEKVYLEEIGSFFFDQNFKLHFESNTTRNYLIDSFGFSEIKLPTQYHNYNIDTTQTIYMDQSNNRRVLLRAAAVTIPILIAISAIQFRSKVFDNNELNYATLNPVENVIEKETIENKTLPLDTAKVGIVVDEMTKPQNALFYTEDSPKEEIKPIGRGTYYLIAGSFSDIEHANKLKGQLIAEGFSNSDILSKKGKYRVTFSVYEDKFEALQELTRIRKEKNDKSVWLLTEKK